MIPYLSTAGKPQKTVPALSRGTYTYSQFMGVPSPPAMLQDYASVKPSTVEPKHHNIHNRKVYMPHQNYKAQYKLPQNEKHGIPQNVPNNIRFRKTWFWTKRSNRKIERRLWLHVIILSPKDIIELILCCSLNLTMMRWSHRNVVWF